LLVFLALLLTISQVLCLHVLDHARRIQLLHSLIETQRLPHLLILLIVLIIALFTLVLALVLARVLLLLLVLDSLALHLLFLDLEQALFD